MSPIFSYFDYRTQPHPVSDDTSIPLIRFQLEKSDQEVGRFWIGLLHAFRAIFPGIGHRVLDSIVDHHHQPLLQSIEQLANELQQKEWELILENTHHVSSTNWWPGFMEWLLTFKENHSIEIQKDSTDLNGMEAGEWIPNVPPELRISLSVSEVWWTGWYLEEFPGEIWSEIWAKLRVANHLNDFSPEIILPTESTFNSLRNQLKDEDIPVLHHQQSRLSDWLQDHGEWLEAIRIQLSFKDFENAGDLLSKHGQHWLDTGADPLEILFWLKEIPGVLMTSRPGLCFLAAEASQKMQLDLQTSYFLNALENQLFSLQRFSKSEAQWHTMELDEKGTTIQSMLEKIQQMRSGEK